MSGRYFGTDGVRGPANEGRLSPLSLTRLGLAVAAVARQRVAEPTILIGRDTRRSGTSMEAALCAGLTAGGAHVKLLETVPTPAVGYLTQSTGAIFGLMITASHNPAGDNGVKLFGADGYKISDADQTAIEHAMAAAEADHLQPVADMGAWTRQPDLREGYVDHIRRTVASGLDLTGMTIAFDGANGAGAEIGQSVLTALGADLVTIGTTPDGMNINDGVGSTAPDAIKAAVGAHKADIGVALDGDADRLLLVDERGREIGGDQVIAALAEHMLSAGTLTGGAVAATVMSNIALGHHLSGLGLELVRTPVGDRHVASEMRARGLALGGEPSGHFIIGAETRTGDGLAAALICLRMLATAQMPASTLFNRFTPAPQTLLNVPTMGADPLSSPKLTDAIAATEGRLGDQGRVLVRKSGTEPLLRIMVEAMDETTSQAEAQALARVAEQLTA